MNRMSCVMCDVGALGATVTGYRAGFNISVGSTSMDAGELFTKQFLDVRTPQSIRSIANYIGDGNVTIGSDGSLTVHAPNGSFKVAPAGSLIVARARQLVPSASAINTATGTTPNNQATSIPTNGQSTGNKVEDAINELLGTGTPTAKGGVETKSATEGGSLSTLLGAALSVFAEKEETKRAKARAAADSSVLNPPTAPAQGSVTNTPNAYGPGFGTGSTLPDDTPSIPTLPALPPAPPAPPAVSGGTQVPPGYGPQPVFPGIPETEYTGDGKVPLNASTLAKHMDDVSRQAGPPVPRPTPFYQQPGFIIGAVVVGGAVVLLGARRRGRRRR